MPRFFVPSINIKDKQVKITGDDAWHIARALRMAVGEHITVCDMQGGVHDCELLSITDEMSIASILESKVSEDKNSVNILLYQALPKGDKMDVIVQKAVEFGVDTIVPFISERCISRPDEKSMQKKIARWQRIALEAAKQCGRGMIPEILPMMSYQKMLDIAKRTDIPCFCYEGDGTRSIKDILKSTKQDGDNPTSISIVIGSEGGFSQKEAGMATELGFNMCGLGKRILRCESASSFALACIGYEFEL